MSRFICGSYRPGHYSGLGYGPIASSLLCFQSMLLAMRKLAVFDPDKALAGGAADFKLWLLLAAYAIATAAAVVISRGAPVSSVGQQLRVCRCYVDFTGESLLACLCSR
jgi:hypothetical protein